MNETSTTAHLTGTGGRTNDSSDAAGVGGTDFVAYEYTTVRVPRDLESVYRDSYRNFGWVVEGYDGGLPHTSTVAIKLKRNRRIKNRAMVLELQRTGENALTAIATLTRSITTTAVTAALSVGIVGSAFLAGSVFAIEADLWPLSIALGVVGLIGWLAGYLTHGRVKANRSAKVNPLIDQQYEIVYTAGEQASHLLS